MPFYFNRDYCHSGESRNPEFWIPGQARNDKRVKKVLILGAKGMLGQELVQVFLSDENYEVFGWGSAEIDISDKKQVEEKIGETRPEIIINAAAYNAVDKCEEPGEFEKAKKINGLAPGFLAEIAKKIKIPPRPPFLKGGIRESAIFVHFSTDYVFDGEKKEGYKENDSPSPISNYGRSKLLGETEVQRVGGRFYLIRLQRLFGGSARSATAKKSFFEAMLKLAEIKNEMEVVDEELANFTFAPDLAERTKYLVENNLPFGIYHITNEGRPATWFGAAKILFEIAGKNIKLVPVPASKFPRPAKRPKYSVLINTELPPLRNWTEALKESLKQV